ncbi:MAG: hypothetical protein WED04_10315 [Promethearchaeati archaeon SRVP18_Atabeyarchaeia-1]
MSRVRPIKYRHRLMVAAGLAYLVAGPSLIIIFFAAFPELLSSHLLVILSSLMLMIDGVALILFSTADVDLVIRKAESEGFLKVLPEEEVGLRQMSRLHNMLIFAAITIYAILSSLFTYQFEPSIAQILPNRAAFLVYTLFVYALPLTLIPESISLYTHAKYRSLKPILDAAEAGFYKDIYYGAHDREKEK